jgi:peptidoglycan-associated lipoprotein
MTRRVDPRLMIVAAGLTLAVTGCASRATPGAGLDTGGAGATGASGLAAGATGARGLAAGGAGTGAASDAAAGAGVHAPGATLFPVLPSPKDYDEAAALHDVHFDFDRATLRGEDARVLEANARWLVAHPGTLVLIEGHADARGTNEYNLALGESRARVTRDGLIARGVAASRITLVSYGEERPTCRETSEGCWAKNRRAHFLVKSPVSVSALQP